MKFYNHYDLDAMGDYNYNQIPDEMYQPVYPCEIECISNDHFTIIASEAFEAPDQFIQAFEELCGVKYVVKHRKYRLDIYLHRPTQFPADFIQEFHQTYDQVQQLIEINAQIKYYPILGLRHKPRLEIINIAKEILRMQCLTTDDKVLRSYYQKIRRIHGPGMHPFYAGSLIVDMVKVNQDQDQIPITKSLTLFP